MYGCANRITCLHYRCVCLRHDVDNNDKTNRVDIWGLTLTRCFLLRDDFLERPSKFISSAFKLSDAGRDPRVNTLRWGDYLCRPHRVFTILGFWEAVPRKARRVGGNLGYTECVHTSVCIRPCVYVRLYTSVCIRPCVYVRLYTSVCIRPFVYVRVYTSVCIRPCVYVRLYTSVCIRPCVYVRLYTSVCIRPFHIRRAKYLIKSINSSYFLMQFYWCVR